MSSSVLILKLRLTCGDACYPAFKLVELNLYSLDLGSAFGSFVAADRLAVTDVLTNITRLLKSFVRP